jgi:hypothetical protein
MPFNIEKARQAGKTDADIADYLINKFPEFNAAKARATGKTDMEIAEYLSGFDAPMLIESPESKAIRNVPEWGKKHPNLYGVFGAGKALYETIGKPGIEMAGLVGGGMAGTPVAGPSGAIGGAGLGYSMAKQITDKVDNFVNRLERNIVTPGTITENMKKVMTDAITGAEMEMGGQLVGAGITNAMQKAMAPNAKKMIAENAAYKKLAEKHGIKPTAADVTQSKSLSAMEGIMSDFVTSADILRAYRIKEQLKPLVEHANKLIDSGAPSEEINAVGRKIQGRVNSFLQQQMNLKGDALNRMRTQILARLGTDISFESLGITGKEILKARSIAAMEKASQMYTRVGEYLPKGELYQYPELTKKAKELLKFKKALPRQDSKMMDILDWAAKDKRIPEDVMNQIQAMPSGIRDSFMTQYGDDFLVKRDWATMQEFRSDLFNNILKEDPMYKAGAFGQKGTSTKEAGVYKQLRKALDKDLENIAKQEGGDAWEAFQAANAFYRTEFKDIYGSSIIKKLASSAPDKLVDIGFKPNGVSEIKLMKRALGPEGFQGLQEGFTKKILGVGKNDTFDPQFLRTQISKYGDETLTEIYGKAEIQKLKQIAEQGLNFNKQTPSSQFLKTITRTYPDTVVDAIIGAPESKLQSHTLVKNLSIIKSAVGKKYIKEQLGPRLLNKIFVREMVNDTIKPHTLTRMVDKYGDRVLKILFEPQKITYIKRLAEIGRRMETAEKLAGNPSGTGGRIMSWGTLGMIIRNPIKGTIMAITPRQMTKLYISDFGLKYLTEGFKTPIGTKEGVELATKLSLIMGNQE